MRAARGNRTFEQGAIISMPCLHRGTLIYNHVSLLQKSMFLDMRREGICMIKGDYYEILSSTINAIKLRRFP